MPAKLIIRKEETEVPAGLTIAQAIRQLGLEPESYLALRKGERIADTEVLQDGDVVKLIAVISGGTDLD